MPVETGPLEIVASPLPRSRLQKIRAYIAPDKPEAAGRLVTRIVSMVEVLRRFPYTGLAGSQPGLRELVLGGTPHILICRVCGHRALIDTIWHGAQRRPD